MNKERLTAKQQRLSDATAMLKNAIEAAQIAMNEATVEILLMNCERWLTVASEVKKIETILAQNGVQK